MSEYNIGFSENLVTAAGDLCAHGLNDVNAKRAVLYLSLLACEVALKAGLEKAGMSVSKIKNRGHDLAGLLQDMGNHCEIEKYPDGNCQWIPATAIRAKPISYQKTQITVGQLIDDTESLTSQYPNEIRYGNFVRHYPPEAVLDVAKEIVEWVKRAKLRSK